jgi:hypothetical protein
LGSLWYYRSLVEAFRQAESTPLVEKLDRTVLELEQFSEARMQDAEGKNH